MVNPFVGGSWYFDQPSKDNRNGISTGFSLALSKQSGTVAVVSFVNAVADALRYYVLVMQKQAEAGNPLARAMLAAAACAISCIIVAAKKWSLR